MAQRLYLAKNRLLNLAAICSCASILIGTILSCSQIEVVESPKTAFAVATADNPRLVWTSRSMKEDFDYLGVIKSRSLSYDVALEQLIEGGKQLHADAVIDVHYEKVGFLSTMQAFAIKYK